MFCRTILTLAAFLLHVRESPFKIWCFNNNSCFDSWESFDLAAFRQISSV